MNPMDSSTAIIPTSSAVPKNQENGLRSTNISSDQHLAPHAQLTISNQSVAGATIEQDDQCPQSEQDPSPEIPHNWTMPPGIPHQNENISSGLRESSFTPNLGSGHQDMGPVNPTAYQNSSIGAFPTAPYPSHNIAGVRFLGGNFNPYPGIQYLGPESTPGSAPPNAPVSAAQSHPHSESQEEQLYEAGVIINGQKQVIAQLQDILLKALALNGEQSQQINRQMDMISKLSFDLAKAQHARMIEEFLNIRGDIEKIVDVGNKQGYIPNHSGNGNQAAIDAMVGTSEFQRVLQEEAGSRALKENDILSCLWVTYHQFSKYAHGTTGHLTLNHRHHRPAEIAALVTILRTQSTWGSGITWEEVGLRASESTQN